MKLILSRLTALLLAAIPTLVQAAETPPMDVFADFDQLVAETHKASLKLREEALRKTIAIDTARHQGIWGDNLWSLSALYVWDEKRTTATPAKFNKAADKSRILLLAGDIASHGPVQRELGVSK